MKIDRIIIILIVLVFAGCTGGLDITKTTNEANASYTAGDYSASLKQWTQLIEFYKSKEMEVPGSVYAGAGKASMKQANTTQALKYFDQAYWAKYGDPEMYEMMADAYLEMDNLSKELTALEYYNEHYTEAEGIDNIRMKLFDAYMKSEQWEKAEQTWNTLNSEERQKETIVEKYFLLNEKLDNEAKCDKIADELLDKNPDNIIALDWLAKKYFWKAENLYQNEMKAYEENRTHKQYSKLLKALDVVNADFKKALQYYEKLYDLTGEKKYAKSLGNIYTRFDDEKKANYYYRLAE